MDDEGGVIGLERDIEVADSRKKNQDGLELSITSKIKDTFGGAVIEHVSTHFFKIDGLLVGELRITPSKKSIFLRKNYFVRNGTQSVKLEAEEFYQLIDIILKYFVSS